MQFLLIHGYTGSGPQHWQSWLAERLSRRGYEVRFPTLPNPDAPRLRDWAPALETELADLNPARTVVVAHSCGSLLWLHHAAHAKNRVARRVLLVSPPGPQWHEPSVDGFIPVLLDRRGVHLAARETRIIAARDDPYCQEDDLAHYAEVLNIELDLLDSGGHLNTASGFGPWPAMETWATARSRASAAARSEPI